MNYSYRYDPAASTADNVSRSLEMDGLRIRLAPTAVQLRARASAPQNGHALAMSRWDRSTTGQQDLLP